MKYLIGIGNYSMGDDGIGLRVVEHIVDNNLDQGFKAIDLSSNVLNLLFYWKEDTEKIVIVDAVNMEKEPGDYLLFDPLTVHSEKILNGISTHEADLLKVIEMGQNLGYRLPPMQILGIEPDRMEPVMELSEKLSNRFMEYVETALTAVGI